MLVKLVRNWRVAVDAFKRDAAIEARVAAKRAEVKGWLAGGDLGGVFRRPLSESLEISHAVIATAEHRDPRRGVVDERRVDGVGREEVVAEPVDEVVALF